MIKTLDSQPPNRVLDRGKGFLDSETQWHAVLQTNGHRQPCGCRSARRCSKCARDARCEGALQKNRLPGRNGSRALLREELGSGIAHPKSLQRVSKRGDKVAMRGNCGSVSSRRKRSAAQGGAYAGWMLGHLSDLMD